ncbi:MarR family transcriptional regulator [Halosimplex rubrum]|uniref:MarR family transcriptional regulator n=1 Tax=Halosimplex rubrum TaxID=869889 RepID=A0A7D5P3P4_9EURY|nr:helix-turn-helix domain-containing protein [Halosimplex rubrum]QLH76722.1 MarR family transcriptional regulator [Halosimplex rubrum]
MPIDIERFEHERDLGSEETHATRILRFLASNDDKAFRRGEIAAETGIDADTVSSVLNRLKTRDLVRHKRPYWAIGDPKRLREASATSDSLAALNDRLGTEDMDEWREAADRDGER